MAEELSRAWATKFLSGRQWPAEHNHHDSMADNLKVYKLHTGKGVHIFLEWRMKQGAGSGGALEMYFRTLHYF